MSHSNHSYIAYIGTYTQGESEGIYAFELDTETGHLKEKGCLAKLENPSYLAIDRLNRYLYSVMETDNFNGTPSGAVAAYKIHPETGELAPINFSATRGKVPCHISTDRANKILFAANYRDGTVSSFPLQEDGSIGPVSEILRHEGCGPNKERQEKAHAHFVSLVPEEKYLCAVDLGIDKLMLYRYDSSTGRLTLDQDRSLSIRPGSGPRHMAFHPDSNFAYLVNELSSDIVVLKYSPRDFTFKEEQYISTLPEGYTGETTCAAIHVSPDGNYVYASNRGHDSIAIFRISKQTGKLEPIDYSPVLGNSPRDFSIDPTGKFLYAANQDSNTITSFSIDRESGKLQPLEQVISLPSPVCIKFIQL